MRVFRYDPFNADHRERNNVPNDNQERLTIWGRANSVNVQKVLWCLRELDLAFQRIDAGMAFGRNHDPDYLAMNPNARVPTLVDGDFASPFCSSSIECRSGERTKAIMPSRGGRLMVMPSFIRRAQVA